ncbi:MAG: hypothetical protein HUJ61_06650 [Bacilli bacterium]|nr:hypothetical protein [Bacilli bacterium]
MARKLYYLLLMILTVIGASVTYDLFACNVTATSLDNYSSYISRLISKEGYISEEIINIVEDMMNANIVCTGNCNAKYGDVLQYELTKDVPVIILSQDVKTVRVNKMTTIGF